MCSPSGGVFGTQGIDIFSVLRGVGVCGQAFHVSRKEMADNFLVLKEGRLYFQLSGQKVAERKQTHRERKTKNNVLLGESTHFGALKTATRRGCA